MDKTEIYVRGRSHRNKACLSLCIYFLFIAILLLINYLSSMYINMFVWDIVNYLSEHVPFLTVKKPIVFFHGLYKLLSVGYMINALYLSLLFIVFYIIFDKLLHCKLQKKYLHSKFKIKYIICFFLIFQFVLSSILWIMG